MPFRYYFLEFLSRFLEHRFQHSCHIFFSNSVLTWPELLPQKVPVISLSGLLRVLVSPHLEISLKHLFSRFRHYKIDVSRQSHLAWGEDMHQELQHKNISPVWILKILSLVFSSGRGNSILRIVAMITWKRQGLKSYNYNLSITMKILQFM